MFQQFPVCNVSPSILDIAKDVIIRELKIRKVCAHGVHFFHLLLGFGFRTFFSKLLDSHCLIVVRAFPHDGINPDSLHLFVGADPHTPRFQLKGGIETQITDQPCYRHLSVRIVYTGP